MKIVYIAKHDSGGNDDEGAITFALEALGHTIVRLAEADGRQAMRIRCDFVLFHKWFDLKGLRRVKQPKVFWYFDLVDYPDPTLASRNQARRDWMGFVIPEVEVGFCTDGDWVNQDKSSKLIRLTQGADERCTGYGESRDSVSPILFTGIVHGGEQRSSHIHELTEHYGDKFQVVRRVHGRKLADLLASSKVAIAPDGPATNHYWSNRVYLTLGLGGFLLHPYCQSLTAHYRSGVELVMYESRAELLEMIDYYLTHDEAREKIRHLGHERTLKEHLYRHRCERLIQLVKERL